MNRAAICFLGALAFVSAGLATSCSKEAPSQKVVSEGQSPTQPTVPAGQTAQSAPASPAVPSSVPTPSDSAEKRSGDKATEKHTLILANYANTGVTVTLNGVWVGQWDAPATVPLDSVVRGKNELVVELQDEPKNAVAVDINAERAGQNVTLLRLNFQGKRAGKYPYTFVAR